MQCHPLPHCLHSVCCAVRTPAKKCRTLTGTPACWLSRDCCCVQEEISQAAVRRWGRGTACVASHLCASGSKRIALTASLCRSRQKAMRAWKAVCSNTQRDKFLERNHTGGCELSLRKTNIPGVPHHMWLGRGGGSMGESALQHSQENTSHKLVFLYVLSLVSGAYAYVCSTPCLCDAAVRGFQGGTVVQAKHMTCDV